MSWTITLNSVTKRFGERVILDRVSLTIPPGETVALLGPSGGGKSTLLRCLNGLNTFDEGDIQVGPHRLRPGTKHPAGEVQQVRRGLPQDLLSCRIDVDVAAVREEHGDRLVERVEQHRDVEQERRDGHRWLDDRLQPQDHPMEPQKRRSVATSRSYSSP